MPGSLLEEQPLPEKTKDLSGN